MNNHLKNKTPNLLAGLIEMGEVLNCQHVCEKELSQYFNKMDTVRKEWKAHRKQVSKILNRNLMLLKYNQHF